MRVYAFVALALSSLIPGLAVAQPYPNKPLKIVVPFTPGGSPDVLARTVAQKLQQLWGQAVIVENQPGAGGAIAAKAVARAPADGYTWLVAPNSVLVFAPLLGAVPYDPVKDFAPIGLAISVENLLVVHPAVPARNVKELLTLAKARPGQLTYASGGPGSPQNFSMELLKSMSGTSIQHVPYKGAQAALPDLLAGRVDVFIGQANTLLPHIESGHLRLLAGTDAKRYASLLQVPTVGEALPGFSVDIWSGFVAPAGTPADVIRKANADLVRVLAMPDVKAVLARQGIEVRSSTPAEMAAAIDADLVRWARVVKDANIKAE
ncbi:Bug family tripartite tricarboxylate transporter substrate binding protein [Variovorax sp. SRS16]|uniref:Bug family tripartite tricarboxylate transporter substrate binding protein n=1 Tax=Variovorax sp. SRS16 TaxID=282217 RepID=UPI001E56DA37|nr:tripartite tricarboxylate transporter substrate-binding protein [Variovorax sp. SRS16]